MECDKYSSLRSGAESGTRGKEWKSELTDREYPTKQTNKLRHSVQDSLVCFRNLLRPKWILCTHSFQVYIGAVSRRDHMLGHKTNLNKFKKLNQAFFSGYNGRKLELNYRKKRKRANIFRLNILLKNNGSRTKSEKKSLICGI